MAVMLEMEMPKTCYVCPFRCYGQYCLATTDKKHIYPRRGAQTREKFCPLKETPSIEDSKERE